MLHVVYRQVSTSVHTLLEHPSVYDKDRIGYIPIRKVITLSPGKLGSAIRVRVRTVLESYRLMYDTCAPRRRPSAVPLLRDV